MTMIILIISNAPKAITIYYNIWYLYQSIGLYVYIYYILLNVLSSLYTVYYVLPSRGGSATSV